MKKIALATLAALAFAASAAQAYVNPIAKGPPPVVTWKCVHASGAACTSAELANGWYKQVLILPSGFGEADRDTFWSEFDHTVSLLVSPSQAGTSWSVQHSYQLLFVGYFVAGGPLGAPDATFGGVIAKHPIRGYATSLSQSAVYSYIDAIRYWVIPQLRPMSAGVLFNSFQTPVTANAAPPSFVQKPFGVSKWTRADLRDRGSYVPTHELAHAGLNYLDEYVESGFENLSIKQIDLATPLVLFDGSWGSAIQAINDLLGVYDYSMSDILANNGNDNIATSSQTSTVYTPGYPLEQYPYEHGMFFGRGTWHMQGSNLMNDDTLMRAWDDGFSFAHSGSQQQVINDTFNGTVSRPNDRLRNAGPRNGWPLALGSVTHVMLFDGDKNHHVHPTQSYLVQVGWYDRTWSTCWWGPFPYPCATYTWKTAQQTVWPQARSIQVKMSSLYGLAKLAQQLTCAVGINEIPSGGNTIRLCDQSLDTIANEFLPTLSFSVPYQDVAVPASQWMTTYWWRFSTNNGAIQSGMTGWSSFYRSL